MKKLERFVALAFLALGMSLASSVMSGGQALAESEKAWLGVQLAVDRCGVQIAEVVNGAPAAISGLQVDDCIVRVAGQPVSTPADVTLRVGRMSVGDELLLQIRRKRKVFESRVILTGRLSSAELLRRRLLDHAAPDFELPVVQGEGPTLKLSDFHGQVVLIEFWATWCQNCGGVHDDLNAALAKNTSDKAGGFAVLSLAAERTSQIDDYLRQHKLSYPVLFDRFARVRASYHAPGLPTLVVVDREGIVRFAGAGADQENVQAAIACAARLSSRPK